jgi:hypothetical protein
LSDQTGFERESDKTRNIVDSKSIHELSAMVLNRFGTDFKDQGNSLGCLAFGDKLKDLALALGKFFEGRLLMSQLLER